MIIINFKDYEEATGENAVKLAEVFEKIVAEAGISGAGAGAEVAIAVHPTDLRLVAGVVDKLLLFSQSGDFCTRNSDGTLKKTQNGRMTPNMVANCGCKGVLVNHAENPCSDDEIRLTVEDFRRDCPKVRIVVCAESVERGERILELCGENKPDFVAVELPEMIGGDISVTTKPEVVKDAVDRLGVDVLVGAGVKNSGDVAKALSLGAKGVLLASGVFKPKDGRTPEQVLRELIK